MWGTMSTALLPVVLLMLLGWFGGQRGYFRQADVGVMATLVMRYALPCSLFIGALKTPPERIQNLPFILCMTFGFVGTYVLALLAGRYYYRQGLKTSAIQALVCTFPDMAYFGAPILQQVCGPQGFIAVLIGNLITSFVILPLTIVLCRCGEMADTGDDDGMVAMLKQSLVKTLSNQIVWLPILGVVLSFNHLHLPAAVQESVDMLAKAAGGVSLLALGLMFCGEKPSFNGHVVGNVAMKNFLQPALMLLGIFLFGVDAEFAKQALIVGAVPTAIAASMFAVRNQTYALHASHSVLVGTVIGVLGEAALIYFMV
ncbi:transporter [Aquitalea sp. USM4]|nr:transporter [Aquitalea sp. USM4]